MSERERVLRAIAAHLGSPRARRAALLRGGVEVRSSGAHVWDDDGRRYLDCGGYGVFILGHCHPRVVEAVVEQVRSHPLSTYLLLNRAEADAAACLARVAPRGLDQVCFACSGAEAVETALKIARLNERRRVIAMDNGYHGLTLAALGVTGREGHRRAFQPLPAGVEFVPFGNLEALAAALASGPPACVLLEPVQGEGGVIVPPSGYLAAVERACRERGALLVLDEIQTGLGRLGRLWGADGEGVTADLLLAGKGLGGGVVPVSAVIGSQAVFRRLYAEPGIHPSTFAGAPIAMAAVKATIDVIESENIVGKAAALGRQILEILQAVLAPMSPRLVAGVRGVGLMIAVEWQTDYLAADFLMELLDRGVIVSYSMNAPRVARLTPPAVIDDDDLGHLESAVRASAQALAQRS